MVERKKIKLKDRKIGEDEPTFIIAEVGINHNGQIETAKSLIKAAKKMGADAVKFQTYITEKRVPKDSPIYDILKKCELNDKHTEELIKFANSNDIVFFSTPFDDESVELLVKFGVPLMKIASFDIVNTLLLEKTAKTGIPTIISRGMANKGEIDNAIEIFKKHNTEYAILHCISAYPANITEANLNVIKFLKERYDCPIGYSDHTLGVEVAPIAVAAGASIIEKHFTLDINADGPDHQLSADPETFKQLIKETRKIESILGSSEIKMLECERGILQYRRPS